MKTWILSLLGIGILLACQPAEEQTPVITLPAQTQSIEAEDDEHTALEGEWQSYQIETHGPAWSTRNGDTVNVVMNNQQYAVFRGNKVIQKQGDKVMRESTFTLRGDSIMIDFPQQDTTVFSGYVRFEENGDLRWTYFMKRAQDANSPMVQIRTEAYFQRLKE